MTSSEESDASTRVISRLRNRKGAALPMTLFLVACITLMLSATMVRVRTDVGIAASSSDVVDALVVADNGLSTYLGTVTERPQSGDSLRINVHGGYAMVVAHLVQRPADTMGLWRYVLTSTGRVIDPSQGDQPQAVRTVRVFADWQQGSTEVPATLITLNGVHYTGQVDGDPTIVIDGYDRCSGAPVAGVRAPEGSQWPDGTTGAPPTIIQGSWQQLAEEMGIDWEEVEGGGYEADYTAIRSGDTTYASYLIEGDVVLTNARGTGILVVTGELETGGEYFVWDGVILVGDEFDPDADSSVVYGVVISGLDRQHGQSVEQTNFTDTGDDVYLYYDSCSIARALGPTTGFIPVDGTWMEVGLSG